MSKPDPIKTRIQKDLDQGKFTRICSNESTFKEYVFTAIEQARKEERKKIYTELHKLFVESKNFKDRTDNLHNYLIDMFKR